MYIYIYIHRHYIYTHIIIITYIYILYDYIYVHIVYIYTYYIYIYMYIIWLCIYIYIYIYTYIYIYIHIHHISSPVKDPTMANHLLWGSAPGARMPRQPGASIWCWSLGQMGWEMMFFFFCQGNIPKKRWNVVITILGIIFTNGMEFTK